MLTKGSKAYSILKMKCPRCHDGDIFFNANPYVLSQFGKMHDRCPVCDLKYDMEPGFFLGAMYVSYGLGIAVAFPSGFIFSQLFPDLKLYQVIGLVLIEIILLMPILYYLSRSIWLNIFVAYRKN
ncbi:MAG: DUF983 domain-containing protein [Bacteroidetes bacterium]|nr:DUF983 domain-containing protein [Bacteroidota bacterium]